MAIRTYSNNKNSDLKVYCADWPLWFSPQCARQQHSKGSPLTPYQANLLAAPSILSTHSGSTRWSSHSNVLVHSIGTLANIQTRVCPSPAPTNPCELHVSCTVHINFFIVVLICHELGYVIFLALNQSLSFSLYFQRFQPEQHFNYKIDFNGHSR